VKLGSYGDIGVGKECIASERNQGFHNSFLRTLSLIGSLSRVILIVYAF
jgi:hypothetical protein